MLNVFYAKFFCEVMIITEKKSRFVKGLVWFLCFNLSRLFNAKAILLEKQ